MGRILTRIPPRPSSKSRRLSSRPFFAGAATGGLDFKTFFVSAGDRVAPPQRRLTAQRLPAQRDDARWVICATKLRPQFSRAREPAHGAVGLAQRTGRPHLNAAGGRYVSDPPTGAGFYGLSPRQRLLRRRPSAGRTGSEPVGTGQRVSNPRKRRTTRPTALASGAGSLTHSATQPRRKLHCERHSGRPEQP